MLERRTECWKEGLKERQEETKREIRREETKRPENGRDIDR